MLQPLQIARRPQAQRAAAGYDDMIMKLDIEQARGVGDRACSLEIAVAGGGVSGRMVVRHDQRRSAQIESAPDDLAGEQIHFGDAAARDDLLGEDAVLGVQKQGVDQLGAFMRQADMEKVERGVAVWQNRSVEHLGQQQLAYQRPDSEQQLHQRGLVRQASGQCRPVRSQQRRKRAEFGEQGGGDLLRAFTAQRSDQSG